VLTKQLIKTWNKFVSGAIDRKEWNRRNKMAMEWYGKVSVKGELTC
jgi:hypothetical protein